MPRLLFDLFQKANDAYQSRYYTATAKTQQLKALAEKYHATAALTEDDLSKELFDLKKDAEFYKENSSSRNILDIMLSACYVRISPAKLVEMNEEINRLSIEPKFKEFITAALKYNSFVAVNHMQQLLADNLAAKETHKAKEETFEQALERAYKQVARSEAELLSKEKANQHALDRVQKQAEQSTSALAAYKTKAREKLASKQDEVTELTGLLESLKKDWLQTYAQVNEHRQKIAELQHTINCSGTQHASSNNKIRELEKLLSIEKAEHQQYMEKFNDMESRFKLLSLNEQTKAVEVQQLKSQQEKLQSQLKAATSSLVVTDILKQKDSMLQQLRESIETLKLEKANLVNQLQGKDKEIYQLEEAVGELSDSCNNTTDHLRMAREEVQTLNIVLNKTEQHWRHDQDGWKADKQELQRLKANNSTSLVDELMGSLTPLINFSLFGPPSDSDKFKGQQLQQQNKQQSTLEIFITPPPATARM